MKVQLDIRNAAGSGSMKLASGGRYCVITAHSPFKPLVVKQPTWLAGREADNTPGGF